MKPAVRASRPALALALAWLLLLLGLALLAPLLPLRDPGEVDLDRMLLAPGVDGALLGTDLKGRDLLARLLFGARISLLTGALGSLLALLVGLPWGALAGLSGGRLDRWMMRAADSLESVPLVVVVLFLLTLAGEYRPELEALGVGRLGIFFLALGLLFWLPTARVARAEALRLRGSGFVQAARALGAPPSRILCRHVLPNLLPAAVVLGTLTVPRVILMEAFLSFLGLGVEPPAVSWGTLAAEGLAALNPLVDCWWLLAAPGAALAATLWSLSICGEALQARLGTGAP